MTKTSATKYMSSAASSSQSSIPRAALVIRLETKRSATAVTQSTVKATPVPMMAEAFLFRPWIVSIVVFWVCSLMGKKL